MPSVTPPSSRADECALCNGPAKSHCAQCGIVSYCSREHQRKHWKTSHRNVCGKPAQVDIEEAGDAVTSTLTVSSPKQPFTLEVGETGIKCMVSTKRLEPGDVIFSEYPAMLSPVLPPQGTTDNVNSSCYGCFTSIKVCRKGHVCSKCGIPLCSPNCETAPVHRDNECQALKKLKIKLKRGKGIFDHNENMIQFLDISVIRILVFREKDPKMWELLTCLEEGSTRYDVYKTYHRCDEELTGENASLLKLSLQYANNDHELVLRAVHLLNTYWECNAASGTPIHALYTLRSTMKHNCVSNTVTVNGGYNSQSLIVKAASVIELGEPITMDFSALETVWSSTQRRREILFLKNIICTCPRCSDPTEFGSFPSAFPCKECSKGVYLPDDPTAEVIFETELWLCSNPDCDEGVEYGVVRRAEQSAMESFQWYKNFALQQSALSSICMARIEKLEELNLGASHYLMLEAMNDYLKAERMRMIGTVNQDFKGFITYNPHWTDEEIRAIQRKYHYSQLLMSYLNNVKKDQISYDKFLLMTDSGMFNFFLNVALLKDPVNRTSQTYSKILEAALAANHTWRKALQYGRLLATTTTNDSSEADFTVVPQLLLDRYPAGTIFRTELMNLYTGKTEVPYAVTETESDEDEDY